MAKKRALVDAALSAGRLSDVFTQDLDETGATDKPEPASLAAEAPAANIFIEMGWLKEALDILEWVDVLKYLREKYNVKGSRVSELIPKMNQVQQLDFAAEVRRRIDTLEEVKEDAQE